jgi:dCMP deaminase
MKRPDTDQYFLKIASVVAERSTCRRHHVGAVAVRDKHILATGYNGAASGLKDCLELGCLRDEKQIPSGTRHEVCRGIHAEQNVIIQASLHGVSLEGSTIYCTHTPCILCAKMLVNAKIARYVSFGEYNDREFVALFREAGIEVDIKKRPPASTSFLD